MGEKEKFINEIKQSFELYFDNKINEVWDEAVRSTKMRLLKIYEKEMRELQTDKALLRMLDHEKKQKLIEVKAAIHREKVGMLLKEKAENIVNEPINNN